MSDAGKQPDWAGPRRFPFLAPYRDKTVRPSGIPESQRTYDVSVEDEAAEGPLPEQQRAFRYFVEHEEAICRNVVDAVFRYYREYRKIHGIDLEEEEAPAIDSPAGLKELIELGELLVWRDELEGHAPLGFSFGCSWDPEHGLGVLVHKDLVVEVGDMDASFSKDLSDTSIWADVRTEEEAQRAGRLEERLDAKYYATRPPQSTREVLGLVFRAVGRWFRRRS